MLPAALEMVAWEVAKMPARVCCRTLGGAVVFSQQLNKPQNIILRREPWSIQNIGFGEL